jgi:addiction module RelE/StbE family toxin
VREILITNRFKKDLKKAKKNPRQDADKLLSVIETLASHGGCRKNIFLIAYQEAGNQNGNATSSQTFY